MDIAQQRINEWVENGDEDEILDLGGLELDELPPLPENLRILNCADNRLTFLPDLPTNLTFLNCSWNDLDHLPFLPESLRTLICQHNMFRTLPRLPRNLLRLNCRNNPLTFPIIIPTSVQYTDLRENQIIRRDFTEEIILEPIVDITIEDLQTRQEQAQTTLTRHQEEMKQRIEQLDLKDSDEEELKLDIDEITEDEQQLLNTKCNNDSTLLGDKLNTRYGNMVIIDIINPDKYVAYCFTYPEFESYFGYGKVYQRHPYIGKLIDQKGYLYSRLYNTLVLEDSGKKSANRAGHHDEMEIYTLKPISFETFKNNNKITKEDIENFIPTKRDLNMYVLKDVKITESGSFKQINGKNASIIVLPNNILNRVQILKNNEGKDINKTFQFTKEHLFELIRIE